MKAKQLFKVKNIIDGNTIEISPNWSWDNASGTIIRIINYIPIGNHEAYARRKLEDLLKDQHIELYNYSGAADYRIHHLTVKILICKVEINGVDISNYFQEYITTA